MQQLSHRVMLRMYWEEKAIYRGVSSVTLVPAGYIRLSWISPLRCDVNVILAWTCSKKLIFKQFLTDNWRVIWPLDGINLEEEIEMNTMTLVSFYYMSMY